VTETCQHRSRLAGPLATPLALLVGAVLISGSSAYAAAQITGKQIKNESVTTKDIKNGSLQGADVKDGSLGSEDLRNGGVQSADLAPGLANRLVAVRTRVGTSADLNPVSDWQWTLAGSLLPAHKVTEPRLFTVSGMVGYGAPSATDVDVAVCSSLNGGTLTYVGGSYGTVRLNGRVNAPVQGEVLAAATTLKIGPCIRAGAGVVPSLYADVSSVTTMITVP
jgi:hypothetical protein